MAYNFKVDGNTSTEQYISDLYGITDITSTYNGIDELKQTAENSLSKTANDTITVQESSFDGYAYYTINWNPTPTKYNGTAYYTISTSTHKQDWKSVLDKTFTWTCDGTDQQQYELVSESDGEGGYKWGPEEYMQYVTDFSNLRQPSGIDDYLTITYGETDHYWTCDDKDSVGHEPTENADDYKITDTVQTYTYKWLADSDIYDDCAEPTATPTRAGDTETTYSDGYYITDINLSSVEKDENDVNDFDESNIPSCDLNIGELYNDSTDYTLSFTYTANSYSPTITFDHFEYNDEDKLKTFSYTENDEDKQTIIDLINDTGYMEDYNEEYINVSYEYPLTTKTIECIYITETSEGVIYTLRSNVPDEDLATFTNAVYQKWSDSVIEIGRFNEITDGKMYIVIKNTGESGPLTFTY